MKLYGTIIKNNDTSQSSMPYDESNCSDGQGVLMKKAASPIRSIHISHIYVFIFLEVVCPAYDEFPRLAHSRPWETLSAHKWATESLILDLRG